MIISKILYGDDHVELINNDANPLILSLTYKAWSEFKQKRGYLNMPFHVEYAPSAEYGKGCVTINDANQLSGGF